MLISDEDKLEIARFKEGPTAIPIFLACGGQIFLVFPSISLTSAAP